MVIVMFRLFAVSPRHSFSKSPSIIHQKYKFSGIEIPNGIYKVGAKKFGFTYDNENPRHEIFLKNYIISKKLVTISEWFA